MMNADSVRAMNALLDDSYFALHDADLHCWRIEGDRMAIHFDAYLADRDTSEAVTIEFLGVRFIELRQPPWQFAYSNYVFPVERTVYAVSLDLSEESVRVSIKGTYGWVIEANTESLHLSPHAQCIPPASSEAGR